MLSQPINLALVLDVDADRSLVETAIPATDRLNVACVVEGLASASRAIQDDAADLLLLACGEDLEGATGVIRSWSATHPGRPVVALAEAAPDYFVAGLFQAGADDVVKLPESPERIMFTLEKAVARHSGRPGGSNVELGSMVCVLGPKGGTGKTVTASNLAVALATAGRRTAVVDLDLQFGDLGLTLGVDPVRTVYDLATSGGALDSEKLDAYLIPHESGLRALLAPVRPDQASAVSTDLMRSVYTLLRATHDVVVVDTPPDFTPHVIAAVDVCSDICLVGMLDSLALKNTKLGLETLRLMGRDANDVALVLNRSNTSVGLTSEDVEAVIGRKPDVLVPSDRDVPRSINEGRPIVALRKRSPVAAAFRSLAGIYLDHEATAVLAADASPNGDGGAGRRRLLRLPGRRG